MTDKYQPSVVGGIPCLDCYCHSHWGTGFCVQKGGESPFAPKRGREAKISQSQCREGKSSPLLPKHRGRKKESFFLLAYQRNKIVSEQNDKVIKLSGLISLL